LSVARHVIDDQWDHKAVGVAGLEKTYLLVDVVALRGVGGADDDERCRGVERYPRLVGQRMPRGKLVPIAKDRSERIRNAPPCSLSADKVVPEIEALQPGVQPLGPTHVCVRVREERLVSKIDRIRQRLRSAKNEVWASGIRLPAIRSCRNLR